MASLPTGYSLETYNLLWPIGPARSGRCPVTAEITGSNPVWVAGKALKSKQLGLSI